MLPSAVTNWSPHELEGRAAPQRRWRRVPLRPRRAGWGAAAPPHASARRSMLRRLARRSARMPSLASRSSDMGSMPFWLITTKPCPLAPHTCARRARAHGARGARPQLTRTCSQVSGSACRAASGGPARPGLTLVQALPGPASSCVQTEQAAGRSAQAGAPDPARRAPEWALALRAATQQASSGKGKRGRLRGSARRAWRLRSMTFCTRASTTARSAATSFSRCSALL